jgi:hypothetical protein
VNTDELVRFLLNDQTALHEKMDQLLATFQQLLNLHLNLAEQHRQTERTLAEFIVQTQSGFKQAQGRLDRIEASLQQLIDAIIREHPNGSNSDR